jgi:hypothetical protein
MTEHDQANQEGDIIDVEEFTKANKPHPPRVRFYRIRIDQKKYEVAERCQTASQLLTLAGKSPVERFQLIQKLRGGKSNPIALDEQVCFDTPGVERFITIPLDQTEGEPRRQFRLPEDDELFLDSLGTDWEAVEEGKIKRVVLHAYPLPRGYTVEATDLNVRIEPGYPDTQIDMVYFAPALCRGDGRAIRAVTTDTFDGQKWQRWSRHRTSVNPWRAGIDSLELHLRLVDQWLTTELQKN